MTEDEKNKIVEKFDYHAENLQDKITYSRYSDALKYFIYVRSLGINKDFDDYCLYIIGKLTDYANYNKHIRQFKLEKIISTNDTTN